MNGIMPHGGFHEAKAQRDDDQSAGPNLPDVPPESAEVGAGLHDPRMPGKGLIEEREGGCPQRLCRPSFLFHERGIMKGVVYWNRALSYA